MISNEAHLFGRVLTAMVTPFDAGLKIDFAALEKVVEHLIKTGTTTLVVASMAVFSESDSRMETKKKHCLRQS